MVCPVDNTPLAMMDRQGIEIDYCPKCRGVWLDRGELDKLIDRSASQDSANYTPEPRPSSYDDHSRNHPKKRKKEGFLGDLFDFGD